MVNHAHSKAASATRHRLTDAAHTENAERLVVDVVADEKVDAPAYPLARMDMLMAFDDAAGRGQQQRECKIGRGVREHVGRVRDQDTLARGGGHIDIVKSHRDVRDHLDAVKLCDHFGGKLVRQLRDDTLLAL